MRGPSWTAPVCFGAELDDNFDGRVDRKELYSAGAADERAGGTPAIAGQGVLTRVELVSAHRGGVP